MLIEIKPPKKNGKTFYDGDCKGVIQKYPQIEKNNKNPHKE